MEPNKLDNQIKMLLATREIQPSKGSFEKMNFMLSKKEVKPKRSFTWVHLAASLLVFFAISLSFFKNEPSKIKDRVLVKTVQKVIKKNQIEVQPEPQKAIVNIERKKPLVMKANKKSSIETIPVVIAEKEDRGLLSIKLISNEVALNPTPIVGLTEKSIPSEINSKIKVDANLLLSKAENELDLSFRDKVLTKINKNYQEVKGALVTRNQQ